MKRYRLGYFFSQAFTSFRRNSAMSVASILVLAACLIIMGSFSLLIYSINYNLQQMYKLDNVIIYLTDGTEISDVTTVLDGGMRRYIDSYTVITKAEALEKQKEKYASHPEIFESLGSDNPLPDTVEIKYAGGAETLEKLKVSIATELVSAGLIEKEYVSSYDVITAKIETLRKNLTVIFLGIWALVLLVALLVIINTMKLSVHARAAEIEVMRYIGASNWFITLPFVLEAVYVAFFALVIALPAQWYIYQYFFVRLVKNITYIEMLDAATLAPYVAGGFVAVSLLIGILSSIFSVKKYSKR